MQKVVEEDRKPVWLTQEEQTIEEFNLEAVAERNRALKQIEEDVTFTKEAFEVLNKHIDSQGVDIGNLESCLADVADETEATAVSLWEAEKTVNRWRWWKAGIFGVGVAAVAAVGSVFAIKNLRYPEP